MKNLSPEQDAWVNRLTARLRVLQAAHIEDTTDSRRPILREEIVLALHQLPAVDRAEALDALAERFPVWQASSSGGFRETAATVDMPKPEPEELVARLLAAAPTLSPEKRRDFAQLLTNAGLAFPPKPLPFELPAEVRAQLGLSTTQPVDPARSLRLFTVLIEVMTALDQLSWGVWRNLAPQSAIRREAFADTDFRRMAARFLRAETDPSGQQVVQLLERTRHLIGGLLSAIGPAGETFSRNFLARFSPDAIETGTVGGTLGGFFVGAEQRCWRKYVELFNEISGSTVERELVNSVIQGAESAMLSAKRTANPNL